MRAHALNSSIKCACALSCIQFAMASTSRLDISQALEEISTSLSEDDEAEARSHAARVRDELDLAERGEMAYQSIHGSRESLKPSAKR